MCALILNNLRRTRFRSSRTIIQYCFLFPSLGPAPDPNQRSRVPLIANRTDLQFYSSFFFIKMHL